MNLIVLSNNKSKCTVYIYLRSLALTDTLALLLVLTYAVDLYALRPKSTYAEAIYGAHIEFPLKQTFNASSTLIVVALTIDRFLALCYPHRSRFIGTRRRAIQMILILILYALCWNIPRIFERSIQIYNDPVTNKTMYIDKNLSGFGRSLYYRIHTILYATMFQFAPLFVLGTLNSCIIYSLHNFHLKRKTLLRSNTSTNEQAEQTHMTIMLIAVVMTFLVLVIPSAVAYIINSHDSYATKVFIIISDVMGEANFAVNFFVYCLFSKEFRRLFRARFCSCHNNKVQVSSNSPVTFDKAKMSSKTDSKF